MFNDVKLQVDYKCEMAFELLRLKLRILKINIKFRGGLLGLKAFLKLPLLRSIQVGSTTNNVNAATTNEVNAVGRKASIELLDDPNMPALEDIIYSDDDEDVSVEADMNNLDAFMPVSPILTTREEPKKVIHALKDPSWIEAMQEELLQFKLQEVWTLVDLPNEKRAIGTKWVFMNKKDERGIVIKNKARLVAQGYTQEEGINYDEVSALIARIEAIRLFLAYASFKDIVGYQMDVKSDFLYGKIEEEVYVCQPPGFEDLDFSDSNDIIFGSIKKSLCTKFEKMMHKKFQISSMGELTFFLRLQVKQKEDEIFISQDKYMTEILNKFIFIDVKIASTHMETQNLLLKDEDGEEVDVYLYRSMIGSLMYLTSSRPNIMFAVCACARYQVNPKVSHLHAIKRIFRYLKGQPKLGLWYPKDSLFHLVAYTDSDYAGASLDRKSTIRVAFLAKPAESEGFEQIVDFLNANPIIYALTINPTIYTLCIEQFWAIVKVKTINREVQLQALVDGKKIIVTEASVRRDL
ncbi:putative ribonuclease H-like domain-containing protein [Tanacetum coccineum]